MDTIVNGQGRVPVSAGAMRVPAGVEAGGQFRASVRQESPVRLGADPSGHADEAFQSPPQLVVEHLPDHASELPAFTGGVVWDQ